MRKWGITVVLLSIWMGSAASLSGCTGGSGHTETVSPSPSVSAATESATESASATAEIAPSTRVNDLNMNVRIHLNQAGYLPRSPKVVVIAADEDFPELKIIVENIRDQKPVWEGKIPAASQDNISGDWVSQANFGELTDEGSYQVKVAGKVSAPFKINKEAYKELFYHVARSYRLQRSGEPIDDPLLGLKLLPGHLQDKEATLYYKDEQGRQPVIDVHGGWYDAGDYGKYMPVAAVTVAQLLLAYELRPEFFTDNKFLQDSEKSGWEHAGEAPDVLTEVKFELDWMLRMQRKDGAVYHKVSGGAFPDFIVPSEDVQDRMVYGMSTYGTAMFAAATAMAARIYEPYDPVYAAQLLKSSKKSQTWLNEHPKAFFRMDEGQNSGSGPYDKATDREERFWALAELLKTTGESGYADEMMSRYTDLLQSRSSFISWNNAHLLGQWAAATAANSPPAGKGAAVDAIVHAADEISSRVGKDGYRSALSSKEYTWASNKNALAEGEIMLLANELKPNMTFVDAAADQLHFVLGRNAMGMSYVTGIGTLYPIHPHHRISAASGILVPGLMVGGPNPYMNDPVLEKMADQGLPPAKSYVDELLSYASNEYAIDYNAPLFFTLAFLK
ncbi:glycoside hydrolase family 9 protein [Cohnella mopanensis]|uniref:glycoside hydrolase family 9 protein n=1 Tax=Cohnella mopanensis TaxID=2911966 RepID=UPI001EF993BE|nr:glycoside hydrolase family 9 protein [Cohnella mopanensis]